MESILENFRSSKNSSVEEDKTEVVTTTTVNNEGTDAVSNVAENTETTVSENVTATELETVETETFEPKEQSKRKIIRVCKVGSDHNFANMNNHDFAFNLLNMKVVTDGCGSGKHSEVGTRLFGQLFARKSKEYFDKGESICEENFINVVNSIFEKMLELCNDTSFIFQNYCFTILVCFEFEDEFVVYSCGDGYIIKENEEGIFFDELDDGEYPCYYIYNFITDKSVLKEYKEGVNFKVTRFSKSEYINIGVASDGLRYSENLLDVEKNKLVKFLHEGKGPQIEVLINRNNRKNEMFHDDISICF
ncbi:MAG: protein phosphatase 2C domain-containing protein [Lachnospiraceae bacterium]|nr:protein phosphatase 2C domain-containing protein [Lachnospiraceae bacterium]